jgi:hypothetical protein
MRTQISTYVDFREVNGGVASSLEQFEAVLKEFPRDLVLRTCSALNTHVASWTGQYDPETQARLLHGFFPKEIAEYIRTTGRPVFHRHQLLFVAQEALRFCAITENHTEPRAWRGLGIVFLMASDHLGRSMPGMADSAENIAGMMAALVPTLEANNVQSYFLKMARSYLMFSRFTEPLRKESGFFDVPGLFREATNVPLDLYQALLFGAISRFAKVEKLRKSVDPQNYAIPRTWLAGPRVAPEEVNMFLAELSTTPDAVAANVRERKPKPDDFTLFRDKPLFGDGNLFFPFDFTFLAEKFDAGPFWRVNFHLAASRRENFHAFWGAVFESYLNWVFAKCVAGSPNQFHAGPVYSNNPAEQVCDGLIVCGDTAVLMEYKGSTFTVRAKYSADAKVLQKELEQKLVGEPKRRKGVRQLADAVARLGRRVNPDHIQGVDFSGVRKVLPLLVMRDDFGSTFGMNTYLDFRFRQLKLEPDLQFEIPCVFALSCDDIEKISPYLKDTLLPDILMARFRQEPSLFSPFSIVRNEVLEGKNERKPQWVYDALKDLAQMTVDRLGLQPREIS